MMMVMVMMMMMMMMMCYHLQILQMFLLLACLGMDPHKLSQKGVSAFGIWHSL